MAFRRSHRAPTAETLPSRTPYIARPGPLRKTNVTASAGESFSQIVAADFLTWGDCPSMVVFPVPGKWGYSVWWDTHQANGIEFRVFLV